MMTRPFPTLACVLALAVSATACGSGGTDTPSDTDVMTACWEHVQAEAEVTRSDIDVTETAIAKQDEGWAVKGTVTPGDGSRLQYYCQLDADLKVTDSQVTTL